MTINWGCFHIKRADRVSLDGDLDLSFGEAATEPTNSLLLNFEGVDYCFACIFVGIILIF